MSAICENFIQNAWKKDLCSNCFKSREEHINHKQKQQNNLKAIALSSLKSEPTKGIMKQQKKSSGKRKVSFPKDVSEVIGFGGEWSESEDTGSYSDVEPIVQTSPNGGGGVEIVFDEKEEKEIQKITKLNTDFNMNNKNLLGTAPPAETNATKKSFASLKLGTLQKDYDGKKQTLQISVVPFGTPISTNNKVNDIKQLFGSTNSTNSSTSSSSSQNQNQNNQKSTKTNIFLKSITKLTEPTLSSEKNENKTVVVQQQTEVESKQQRTVPVVEKTLLEEISETLEKNNSNSIKLEISNPIPIIVNKNTSSTQQQSINSITTTTTTATTTTNVNDQTKRTITRHIPIKKDQIKPKITVFTKSLSSESSDSNVSDQESGLSSSAYYDDVVEMHHNSYENVPDGFDSSKAILDNSATPSSDNNTNATIVGGKESNIKPTTTPNNKTSFFSSQLISDMFLSKKPISEHLRKRSEVYNLTDKSYITSKITSDGLIVTRNSNENDDVHDSSGSSFDSSSSDEEMSSMNRSESDSGIGICVSSNEYQNIDQENRIIKDFSGYDSCDSRKNPPSQLQLHQQNSSTNNSDYEDIQVAIDEINKHDDAIEKKSRELAGEPDGRSDPDGSAEAPALPLCPPPTIDIVRQSFLHGFGQSKGVGIVEKPKVPTKPTVSVIKTFAKRNTNQNSVAQQQVILQLQQVIQPQPIKTTTVTSNNTTATILASPTNEEISKLDKNCSVSPTTNNNKKGRAPNPPPSPTEETKEEIKISSDDSETETLNSTQRTTTDLDEIDLTNGDDNKEMIKSVEEQQSTLYTRNPLASLKTSSNSPVVREKDKRERAIINPKFRSLNNFTANRQSAPPDKSRSITPEPAPRKSLSLSQDSLNVDCDKKKKKFSIKKFLRMGSSSKSSDTEFRKDNYGDIPTVDFSVTDPMTNVKPRLVIIHPLDINNTGVEVVKDIRKSTSPGTSTTTTTTTATTTFANISPNSVTKKPPAPPIRSTGIDGKKSHDINKPARPPPPKSAELRRKQITDNGSADVISEINKTDNVYANLGESEAEVVFFLNFEFFFISKHFFLSFVYLNR